MKGKQLIFFINVFIFAILTSSSVEATIVRIETNQGMIDVNLYDNGTPQTVANFLAYVNNGDYSNSIIHRSVPGFIIQGGGFAYNGGWPAVNVFTDASVTNEPVYANVRGTIAMAKLANDPNSATNQWFFNLADNRSNLDNQNGGFTVFGEVVGSGMTVVDQIAALQRYNFGGVYTDIPLANYDGTSDPTDSNLVIISSISILDSTVNTAASLNPSLNNSSTAGGSSGGSDGGSSGGGTIGFLMIALLLMMRAIKIPKL